MTAMGTRMVVDAVDVLAGDFTTSTGYRRVSAVEHVTTTSGRGRKRATTLTSVRFHRVDGTVDSPVFPDSVVTVYRQPAPCEVCGAGQGGRCDPPDEYEGDCPHGCSPER